MQSLRRKRHTCAAEADELGEGREGGREGVDERDGGIGERQAGRQAGWLAGRQTGGERERCAEGLYRAKGGGGVDTKISKREHGCAAGRGN
jgi:hypothetical protein